MADIEVENILREIRERVYAEQEAAAVSQSSGVNGDETARENEDLKPVGSLPRLDSYLTTTARAWDRLPPVVSNRSGTSARIELWLKRHFKRATRWYAWEQVNFNAAVHHALRDIVQLLSSYEKKIENQSEQLRAETEARQQHQSELQTLRLELAAQRLIAEQSRLDARSGELRFAELREGMAHLQEEQRVSYKQLALETSEAAVLEDRARRKTEALLEQLQRRIEQLEK
jgi:hypothetical protein